MSDERGTYIGGLDAGTIVGLNPYESPINVAMRLKGRAAGKVATLPMKAGLALEGMILDEYEERHGVKLVRQPGFMRHPRFPWAGGHIDAMPEGSPVRLIIDAKSTQRDDGYGDEGTDSVPSHIIAQAAWYMPLVDADACDIAVLFRNRDYREYHITRDVELEAELFAACEEFYQRYVVGDEVPELDGSEGTRRYLADRYPTNNGEIVKATPDLDEMVAMLKSIRGDKAKAEQIEATLQARIEQAIGEADGIETALGKITWRRSSDSKRLDVKALQADPEAAPLVARHMKIVPGTRRFLAPRDWGKEE